MKVVEREVEGVLEISLNPFLDERGFFMRAYDVESARQFGFDRTWVQENHSCSKQKGIIRGLHFQFPPFAEAKLIRAIRGAVYDVYVDLRIGSPTFGKWGGIELSESNKKMLLIPRGFAHGFCTLTDTSEVLYKVDNPYNPEAEGGIVWNDSTLAIDWPEADPLLSQRDTALGTFESFVQQHGGI